MLWDCHVSWFCKYSVLDRSCSWCSEVSFSTKVSTVILQCCVFIAVCSNLCVSVWEGQTWLLAEPDPLRSAQLSERAAPTGEGRETSAVAVPALPYQRNGFLKMCLRCNIYFVLEADQCTIVLESFLLLKNLPMCNYRGIKIIRNAQSLKRMKQTERNFSGSSAEHGSAFV